VIKTVGCAATSPQVEALKMVAKEQLKVLSGADNTLFLSEKDSAVEQVIQSLSNSSVSAVGPEFVFGRIYDFIGFGAIRKALFRHLVVVRLAFPLSKLKTVDYLYRYQVVKVSVDSGYRFLDKLNEKLKSAIERIAFEQAKRRFKGNISVVF
jgi:hypothetical protein